MEPTAPAPSFAARTKGHRQALVKFLLIGIAVIVAVLAVTSFLNSNHIKAVQSRQAQAAVAAHTQTLNEIKNIVSQLEQNNQTNHDTTIAYLECIVQGLINTTPASSTNAQTTFNSCIAVSGIQNKIPATVPAQ